MGERLGHGGESGGLMGQMIAVLQPAGLLRSGHFQHARPNQSALSEHSVSPVEHCTRSIAPGKLQRSASSHRFSILRVSTDR